MKKNQTLKFARDTEGDWVDLPLSMLMQTVFFGGYKGSGKTTAMKKLFEAAHEAGAQCVSVAPLGKWYSLRVAKNGKGKGLRGVVVFGGEFGDVPILPGSGKIIARAVHTKKLHAVLDVELMRKDDRAVFLADFFEELMILRKKGRHSAMVVFLDETQSVAPQMSTSKEVARLRSLLGDFARECRNFSCGLVMSAQRSASVDKELIALCDMLIVMRTVHNLDRKAYKLWIDEKGEGEDEDSYGWLRKLRRLTKGEAYLYAPEQNVFERVKVEMIKTFDATATATIGAKVAKVGRLGKLDVKKLSAELGELVERVAAENPATLKAKIAELERALKTRVEQGLVKAAEKVGKPPKIDKRTLRRIENAAKLGRKVMHELEALFSTLKKAHDSFAEGAKLLDVHQKLPAPFRLHRGNVAPPESRDAEKARLFGERYSAKPEAVHRAVNLPPIPKEKHSLAARGAAKFEAFKKQGAAQQAEVSTPEAVVGKQKVMLRVLANGFLDKRELAGAVAQARGGTFDAYVSRLKTWGYVEEHGDQLGITPKGLGYVDANGGPLSMSAEAILDRNSRFVVGKMKAMVNFVRDNPGSTKAQVIEGVGQAPGGTADAYVSRLVSREIFVKDGHTYSWSPMMQRGRTT